MANPSLTIAPGVPVHCSHPRRVPESLIAAYFARRSRKVLLALAGLWLLLYGSFTLLRPPLLDDADSVHAEVAREMVERHDWVTLHANGIRYLEKAPLMYWAMAGSFAVFGPEDWAARLPLALAVLALLLVVDASGPRFFNSGIAGFYAALIMLTSFGVFIYTRILIPDVIVCLWLSLAMLLFWISLEQEQPSRATAWGFAAACALECAHQGADWHCFPAWDRGDFSLAQSQFAPLAAVAPLLQPGHFFADCGSLARGGRNRQSRAGFAQRQHAVAWQCAWLLLVLLY